jgi:hypothetical protein
MPRKQPNMKPVSRNVVDPSLRSLPEFNVMLDYLISVGFKYIDVPYDWAIIQKLDKFRWRPDTIRFTRFKSASITPSAVFHHGIHTLMGACYGFDPRGLPHTTLLSEALAISNDLYFYLRGINEGLRTREMANYTVTVQEIQIPLAGKQSDTDFVRFIRKLSKDPYQSYCAMVTEMFDMHCFLYSEALKKKTAMYPYDAFVKRVRSYKLAQFFVHADLSGHVAYALLQAGRKPSGRDQEAVRDCKRRLLSSPDYLSFIRSLMSVQKKQELAKLKA